MATDDVVAKFIQVHREYQQTGGFDDRDKVTDDTCPLGDLAGFESDFIPEIVRRIARELGNPLAKGTRVKNIYVEKGRKLNIREIAKKFVEKYARKGVTV
jgi:hypothetical protein